MPSGRRTTPSRSISGSRPVTPTHVPSPRGVTAGVEVSPRASVPGDSCLRMDSRKPDRARKVGEHVMAASALFHTLVQLLWRANAVPGSQTWQPLC